LAPCLAFASRLSRLRRAGPSASLDKSAVLWAIELWRDITTGCRERQSYAEKIFVRKTGANFAFAPEKSKSAQKQVNYRQRNGNRYCL
jgi:hypothetical protein